MPRVRVQQDYSKGGGAPSGWVGGDFAWPLFNFTKEIESFIFHSRIGWRYLFQYLFPPYALWPFIHFIHFPHKNIYF